jgi:tetratricopeptide (TPR) repeat protein
MNFMRNILCVAACACLWPAAYAGEANPQKEILAAWETASNYRYNEAYRAFRQLRKEDDPAIEREATFGVALMLLNVQPKTTGNIARARKLFEGIAGDGGGEDLAVQSLYYIGRIYQTHQRVTDYESAARNFLLAMERGPDHAFGQLAVVRLANVWLYEPVRKTVKLERYEQLREWGADLTFGPARRDFNYVMGVACLCFDLSPERAIEHLKVLETVEVHQPRSRASLYARIGETARKLGETSTARVYFQKFLNEFPRELRTQLIRDRLNQLDAQP